MQGVDCDFQAGLDSAGFMRALSRKAREDRVPLCGSLDLTHRCNLRCVHCYVGHLVAQPAREATELPTASVLRLVAEAARAGCVFLLISGGEPLLRDDFVDVYAGARRLGLIVSVFTNATLLSPAHETVFQEFPPHLVEISLYGATKSTYERVTRVPGSYARAIHGLDRLQELGIRVGLKTMILQENVGEIDAMRAFARERGLRFRVDPLVTPRLDGDPAPLAQRVEASQAVDIELNEPGRVEELADYMARHANEVPTKPYACSAGVSAFNIDPAGLVRPCFMSRRIGHDGLGKGFAAAWQEVGLAVERANQEKLPSLCAECRDILLCGYCAGLFDLEASSLAGHVDYVCGLGRRRQTLIADERTMCDAKRE